MLKPTARASHPASSSARVGGSVPGREQVIAATREGFPVLDGVSSFLRGAKCLLDYRDHLARKPEPVSARLPPAAVASWRAKLAGGTKLEENDAMKLLRDFNLPANPGRIVESESAACTAARDVGYPVVLKTAARGIDHKSDRDGVRLNIQNEAALTTAYRDLSSRIDPRVLLAPMVGAPGVEMLLGMVHDEQFGPVVLLGFGGVHVEALADVVYALPPFDAAEARRLVDRLRLRALLGSKRHKRPPAVEQFCETAAGFSALVAELRDAVSEIDLNPVIVHGDGCVIVDALIVSRQSHNLSEPKVREAI